MTKLMNHQFDTDTRAMKIMLPCDVLSTNARDLRREIFEFLETPEAKQGWQTLKLDLTHARMIDSVGLNLVVAVVREAKKADMKIQVMVKDPNVHRTFVFTRLDQQLELVKV